MGYTHYWERHKEVSPEDWELFTRGVQGLCDLAKEDGLKFTLDELTDDEVIINGGHETFWIHRVKRSEGYGGPSGGFNFCKTARKSYDTLVVAVLIHAKEIGVIAEWESDGEPHEHQDGYALVEREWTSGATSSQDKSKGVN